MKISTWKDSTGTFVSAITSIGTYYPVGPLGSYRLSASMASAGQTAKLEVVTLTGENKGFLGISVSGTASSFAISTPGNVAILNSDIGIKVSAISGTVKLLMDDGRGIVIKNGYAEASLVEILSATKIPTGIRARPFDVAGCTLEMGADGLWTGASVGTLTQVQADALVASGVLASVKVGTPGNVAGTLACYGGVGVGWVRASDIGPGSHSAPFTTIAERTAWATQNLAALRSGASTVWGPGNVEHVWNGPLATDWVGKDAHFTEFPMQLLPTSADIDFCAAVRGANLSKEMQSPITDLAKPGDLMVHVASFCIIAGYVYATYYANRTTTAEDPTKHIARFCYFQLSDPETKTFVDLCSIGDVIDGQAVTKIYDTILLRRNDTTLYLMWTVEKGGVYYRVYRTFDVATKSVNASTNINRFAVSLNPLPTTSGSNIPLGAIGVGNIAPLTPEVNGSWKYSIVDASPGETFTVSGIGGSNPRQWAFLDSDNRIISMAEAAATTLYAKLVAPALSAKLVINSMLPADPANISFRGALANFSTTAVANELDSVQIPHKPMIGDIGLMQRLTTRTENGVVYYYTGCYIGEFNCIVKSPDLISWEFVSQPDFDNASQWENSVFVAGDKCFYFCRQKAPSRYAFFTRFDLVAKTWQPPVYVLDSQSRADIFSYAGFLWVIHAPIDRNHISCMHVDQNDLHNSREVQTALVPDYFYPFVQVSGSDIYIMYTASRLHIYLAKVTIGTPTDASILDKLATTMS